MIVNVAEEIWLANVGELLTGVDLACVRVCCSDLRHLVDLITAVYLSQFSAPQQQHNEALLSRFGVTERQFAKVPSLQWLDYYRQYNSSKQLVAVGEDFTVLHHPSVVATFTSGRGRHGVLGSGRSRNCALPFRISCLDQIQISSIVAGETHTLLLGRGGIVFSFGQGLYGRLGHGDDADISSPRVIRSLLEYFVVEIAAGTAHSLICTLSGKSFGFGWNVHGMLSLAFFSDIYVPTRVLADEFIVAIAAGAHHSLFVNIDGRVFGYGAGFSKKSTMVEHLKYEHIVQVAAGGHHSVALSSRGKLYAWGSLPGEYQNQSTICNLQVENSESSQTSDTDGHLQYLRISKLICGKSSIAFTTKDHRFFVCDRVVMHLDRVTCISPKLVVDTGNEMICDAALGSSHMVVRSTKNIFFTCGNGLYGKLMLGDTQHRSILTELNLRKHV